MTVTSAPIGSSGQSLDGFAVNANVPDAFRESVVLTDPNDPAAVLSLASTQPIGFYGVPIWVQGTPSVAIAGVLPNVSTFPIGTTQVFGQVSSFVVNQLTTTAVTVLNPQTSTFITNTNSSTFVTNQLTTTSVNVLNQLTTTSVTVLNPQSSTFVTNLLTTTAVTVLNASTFVTNQLTTTSVNVISSAPHALVGTSQVFGTVSTQIVSSIPFFVSQSTNPWTINGGINISSQAAVSSSWPLSTTLVNIVSSVPFFISQSSGPFVITETGTSATNIRATSVVLLATLNTTVIKAGPGCLYGYQISNFASTSLFVKFANASSAVIASTAVFLKRVGVAPSTTIFGGLDVGANFSTGITMFTTRNAWDQDLTAPLGSTAVANMLFV